MGEGTVCIRECSFYLFLLSSNIVEPTDSCMKFAEAATEFAISLLQTLVTDESRVVISELHNLVDALAKVVFVISFERMQLILTSLWLLTLWTLQLAAKPGSPEPLQQLIEIVRNPAANANANASSGATTAKDDKARQSKDKKVSRDIIIWILALGLILSYDTKTYWNRLIVTPQQTGKITISRSLWIQIPLVSLSRYLDLKLIDIELEISRRKDQR